MDDHRDPCDRLIVAAARARGRPVVTPDTRFAEHVVPAVD